MNCDSQEFLVQNHKVLNLVSRFRFIEDSKRDIKCGSSKLEELGFEYKYDAKMIISDTLKYSEALQETA